MDNDEYMREVYCTLASLAEENTEILDKIHADGVEGTIFKGMIDGVIASSVDREAIILVHAMNTAGISINKAAKALYIANIGMDRYKKG